MAYEWRTYRDTRFVERSEDWWCALDEALFSAEIDRRESCFEGGAL